MEVTNLRVDHPDLRLGKNGSDFFAFSQKTQEVHILLSVRKQPFSPLQLTIGDPKALQKVKLDSDKFQALIDAAQSELKSRERVRQ